MAITTAMTQVHKVNMLNGTFSGITAESPNNTHKLALYTSSSTMDATTAAYGGPTNEVAATGGYSTTGEYLVVATVPTWTTNAAWCDFEDLVWSSSTITARGCLIYDTGNSNAAISVHDFGADKSSSSGDFTVVFPTGDNSTGILRIA